VPVAVAGGSKRVDREDLAATGPQDCDEQASAGLDGHRHRRLRAVTVLGQELQQHPVTGRVIADPPLGQQFAGLVDQRDVVVPLCRVDPAEHSHTFSHPRVVLPGHEVMRVTRRPNPRTRSVRHLSSRSRHQRTPGASVCARTRGSRRWTGGRPAAGSRHDDNGRHALVGFPDVETPEPRRSLVRPNGRGDSQASACPAKPTTVTAPLYREASPARGLTGVRHARGPRSPTGVSGTIFTTD
jgi:hypothetical protein